MTELSESLVEKLLYPGCIFQLIVNSGLNNKSVFPVKVEQLDADCLVLSLLEGKEQLGQFQPGSDIIGICKSDNGALDYVFNAQLIESSQSDRSMIHIRRPLQIRTSERSFFRLDVNLSLTCFKGEQKITGVIANLSAGGLYGVIQYDQRIEPGISLACQFCLPNSSKPLLLIGKVIRTINTGDMQEIALCFQMLDKNIEALITSFLFQHQRKLINETRKKIPENIVKSQLQFKYLAG